MIPASGKDWHRKAGLESEKLLFPLMLATIFASKLVLIAAIPGHSPYWDQWDSEAAFLYKPYFENTLGLQQLLSVHNEHRILALAFLIALTVAYTLNRRYAFDSESGRVEGRYRRIALMNHPTLSQVWLISVGLAGTIFPALEFTRRADSIPHISDVDDSILTGHSAYEHKAFTDPRTGVRK